MTGGTTSYEVRLTMCGLAFEDAVVEDANGRLEDAFAPAGRNSLRGWRASSCLEGEARAARGREAARNLGRRPRSAAMLRKEQPETEFIICLGEDAFDDLITGKWHRGRGVVSTARFHRRASSRVRVEARAKLWTERDDRERDTRRVVVGIARDGAEGGMPVSSALMRRALPLADDSIKPSRTCAGKNRFRRARFTRKCSSTS